MRSEALETLGHGFEQDARKARHRLWTNALPRRPGRGLLLLQAHQGPRTPPARQVRQTRRYAAPASPPARAVTRKGTVVHASSLSVCVLPLRRLRIEHDSCCFVHSGRAFKSRWGRRKIPHSVDPRSSDGVCCARTVAPRCKSSVSTRRARAWFGSCRFTATRSRTTSIYAEGGVCGQSSLTLSSSSVFFGAAFLRAGAFAREAAVVGARGPGLSVKTMKSRTSKKSRGTSPRSVSLFEMI